MAYCSRNKDFYNFNLLIHVMMENTKNFSTPKELTWKNWMYQAGVIVILIAFRLSI